MSYENVTRRVSFPIKTIRIDLHLLELDSSKTEPETASKF